MKRSLPTAAALLPCGSAGGNGASTSKRSLPTAAVLLLAVVAVPVAARTAVPAVSSTLEPAQLAAQTGAPAVSSTLEPAQIAVGDRARLVIRVEHDAGASVTWPDPESLGPFEVLERRVDGPRVEGDRAVSSAELVLTAFELGDLEVPALDIEVVDADGNTVMLETEPAPVAVASVGLDEGGDIRAIRGPLDIPLNVLTLLPWLVGILLLAGIGYWLWRRSRGRAPDSILAPVEPPRPAHETAYEAFRILEAERLPERGEIKTFHIRASDIVRAYVEGRFGVDALEMTTREVLDGLRGQEVPDDVRFDFRRLLERCDLVKFAKDRPVLERCREVIPLGRSLVDRTRVVVAAPEPATDSEPAPAEAGTA